MRWVSFKFNIIAANYWLLASVWKYSYEHFPGEVLSLKIAVNMSSLHVGLRDHILLKYSFCEDTVIGETPISIVKVYIFCKYLCSNWLEQRCFLRKNVHNLQFRQINHKFLSLIEVFLIEWELNWRCFVFFGIEFDSYRCLVRNFPNIERLRNLESIVKAIVNLNSDSLRQIYCVVFV
jgi:hypothetical protein